METKTAMKWALALLVGFGIIALGFRYAGWLLTSFFVLNCLVLIIVVLLQSCKAANLAGHVAAQLETRFATAGRFAASRRAAEKTLTGTCRGGFMPPSCFSSISRRSFDTLHHCLYDGSYRGRGGTGRRTSLRC